MKKFLYLAFIAFFCVCNIKAQVAEVSDSLVQVYKSSDSRFYTFNYPSKSATGEDVVLSSLLIAWTPSNPAETDSIESLHIYSHYTITANQECPSLNQDFQIRLLFGTLANGKYNSNPDNNYISRCVIIAPDYEGYGVSKDRNHPYLAEELTAKQVMDAVQYGLELYQKHVNDERALAIKSDWRSFSIGYSQGGAVALAVQRHIEQNNLSNALHFRGSICGDGPYDLIATLRYYLNDNGTSYDTSTDHLQGMTTLPMVIPLIIKGMLDTHPDMQTHTLEDYLSQQFLDTGIMDWIASKTLSTGDMGKKWYQQLQEGLDANGRHYTPEQMAELFYSPSMNTVWGRLDKLFTPGFADYTGQWVDLYQAMADNGVASGWQPQHRIQFVHARGDMVVPFGNYLAFRDAHQEDEGELFRIDDSITSTDHSNVGMQFFISLAAGLYGDYFQWLDESPTTTDIEKVFRQRGNDEETIWYSLDGRRLNGRPTTKGIYVFRGKKIAIK